MKRILIMGSTGSIGSQALDIIRDNRDKFCVSGLSCRSRIENLIEQIREFNPLAVCVGNEQDALKVRKMFPEVEVFYGDQGLVELADVPCDIVLNSLMGISGLAPTYRAIRNGRDIALANKETLVTGGKLITDLVAEHGVKLLPVDSEHSAIFQCLMGNKNQKIKRLLLTASGGPFRKSSLRELQDVTIEQALNHPKWSMGSKITIDSATMMNKGLEVIEAKWLFDVDASAIDIHVHPESIVHSMVEFEDNSILAQLGLPDMKIPISYAFNFPDRLPLKVDGLDFFTMASELHFEKPRRDVFKCIDLAYRSLAEGGTSPVVLNGANEELIAMFLEGEIGFLDIPNTIERVMDDHKLFVPSSIDEILAVDIEARAKARELVKYCRH